jgi:hypothetical protein
MSDGVSGISVDRFARGIYVTDEPALSCDSQIPVAESLMLNKVLPLVKLFYFMSVSNSKKRKLNATVSFC